VRDAGHTHALAEIDERTGLLGRQAVELGELGVGEGEEEEDDVGGVEAPGRTHDVGHLAGPGARGGTARGLAGLGDDEDGVAGRGVAEGLHLADPPLVGIEVGSDVAGFGVGDGPDLEVVDEDEGTAGPRGGLEPFETGEDLLDRGLGEVPLVEDEDAVAPAGHVGLGVLQGLGEEVLLGGVAQDETLPVHFGQAALDTGEYFHPGHLEGEEEEAGLGVVADDVYAELQGQGRLAHVGGGGQEHQAPEAQGGLVEGADGLLRQADEGPAPVPLQVAGVSVELVGQGADFFDGPPSLDGQEVGYLVLEERPCSAHAAGEEIPPEGTMERVETSAGLLLLPPRMESGEGFGQGFAGGTRGLLDLVPEMDVELGGELAGAGGGEGLGVAEDRGPGLVGPVAGGGPAIRHDGAGLEAEGVDAAVEEGGEGVLAAGAEPVVEILGVAEVGRVDDVDDRDRVLGAVGVADDGQGALAARPAAVGGGVVVETEGEGLDAQAVEGLEAGRRELAAGAADGDDVRDAEGVGGDDVHQALDDDEVAGRGAAPGGIPGEGHV